jgi:hypothetical protein
MGLPSSFHLVNSSPTTQMTGTKGMWPAAGLILLLLSSSMAGCRGWWGQPAISADTLVVVLADLHLVQAYYTSPRISGVNPPYLPQTPGNATRGYTDVLQRHHLSTRDFESSFDYYILRPAELDSIYKRVITLLDSQQVRSFRSVPKSP